VLKHVQPHEISFSTSVTERITWVDVCYNITASCVLHVINNYAVKFSPVKEPDLLQYNMKNNNKPVLKHVQPHEISFSTSVTERISWVDVCYSIKASCFLHVINNYAVIIFACYIARLVQD
jgi:uncharacterized protein (DUF1015 family)